MSARAIASICCSPPDIVPAYCVARSFRRGKKPNMRSMSGCDLVLVVAQIRAHLQVLDDRHAREDAAAFRHHRQAALEQSHAPARP